MRGRGVWVAVAVLCLTAQFATGLFAMGNTNKAVGFVTLFAGFAGFLLAILQMRVKGPLILAGLVVFFGAVVASATTSHALYLAVFGRTAECEVLRVYEVDTSRTSSEPWYSLQCGDRRLDDVELDTYNHPLDQEGDRIPVVLDRNDLVSPARPGDVGTAGVWLLPLALVAALGFVAFAATRRPRERDRGSAG
ncbi:hypothetical protein ACFV4N_10635 [Actinosynnema sp. NPDC059797]